MLRASSDAIGLDVDLAATTGRTAADGATDGGGVPDGAILIAFAEAAVRAESEDLARGRSALLDAVGAEGAAHAAATVSAFSGLVRVADGTGIPIDDGLAAVSADARADLGLQAYGGAANSPGAPVTPDAFTTVDDLFGHRAAR